MDRGTRYAARAPGRVLGSPRGRRRGNILRLAGLVPGSSPQAGRRLTWPVGLGSWLRLSMVGGRNYDTSRSSSNKEIEADRGVDDPSPGRDFLSRGREQCRERG